MSRWFLRLVFVVAAALSACRSTAPDKSRVCSRKFTAALNEAAAAWDALESDVDHAAEARYERAVASLLRIRQREASPRTWTASLTTGDGAFRWVPARKTTVTDDELPAHAADSLREAAGVKQQAGATVAAGEGVGVPMVLRRARDPELLVRYPFLPPNGVNAPVTAIVRFSPPRAGAPREAALHLLRPDAMRAHPTVAIGRRTLPLAWNFSAAVELVMNDGTLSRFGLRGLLKPESTLDACQMYRLDAYDPDRIPVIFVHGLVSDPHIWANAINAIYADPALRRHFQPWFFLYPTGLNVPASSLHLRRWMEKTRAFLDPEGDDPGMQQAVLVGHSMGGLLSRMQVIDPGDHLWNAFFTCPPDKLRMDDDDRARVADTLRFKHCPWVRRVIFVAVPHRGSRIADLGLVRWASRLVRLPVQTLEITSDVLRLNSDAVAEELRDMRNFISVGNLGPDHPFFRGIAPVPIPVPHHSIIGDRGKGDSPKSSDGVVPYWSSHLDSAVSEHIVPRPHSCVEKPETVAEIRRLLFEHLRSVGRVR